MDTQALKERLEGEVLCGTEVPSEYSEDTSIFHIQPECVVFPKNTNDLKELILFAEKHKVSLSARSAGTGMTGGSLTNSIVVDFTKYFNEILEVGDGFARTQPGVFYRDFEKATLAKDLLLPCYTASRELNTVGGMVGNNSGGEKSLTFGKTEQFITSLKFMLRDGNIYEFTKLSRKEFEAKQQQDTLEGEIYRKLGALLEEHHEEIKAAKPDVSKNSAGYYLWNVYDEKEDTYDLTRLIVGSQGTFGFITEITFRLITPKKVSRLLVFFLREKHMRNLGELVNAVLKHKPESFESYDDHTFGIVIKVLPSLLKRLGGNIFSIGLSFLPEVRMVLTGGIPKLVLLAEFTGDSEEEVLAKMNDAHGDIKQSFSVPMHQTTTKEESDKYWVIRRESFNLLRKKVGNKHTAPFVDDIAVRPDKLPAFLPRLYDIMNEYNITYTIAGHVGDGNFHIIPLVDFTRPDFKEMIHELSQKVYDLVIEFKGTITGEHNDGIIRTPYLEKMYGKKMIELFTQVKDIFDPNRIFNPHKKVDADEQLLFNSIKDS